VRNELMKWATEVKNAVCTTETHGKADQSTLQVSSVALGHFLGACMPLLLCRMWQWPYKMPSRSANPAPTKQAQAPVDRGGRSLALPLQVGLLVAGGSVKVLVSRLLVGGTE
jgi:hypothetical protein